jgi:hypothetical protein
VIEQKDVLRTSPMQAMFEVDEGYIIQDIHQHIHCVHNMRLRNAICKFAKGYIAMDPTRRLTEGELGPKQQIQGKLTINTLGSSSSSEVSESA